MVRGHKFAFEMLVHNAGGIITVERDLADDHVVVGGAKCVDVCLRADVNFSAYLFGADVIRCPEGATFFGFGGFFVGDGAGESHVGQFRNAFLREHDVLGLYVAVDEASLVRVLKRFSDLEYDIRCFSFAEFTVLSNDVVDRRSIHIFHDEIVKLTGLTDIERLHDIGMIEAGGGLPFFVESLNELDVRAEFLGENFDCDGTIERELAGKVHGCHGPGAEFSLDFVAGDLLG